MSNKSEIESEREPSSESISARELMLRRDHSPLGRGADEQGVTTRVQINGKPPAKSEFDLLRHIRLALRGRMAWVLGLGILTGAAGGYAGWKTGHPVYTSAGLVRIAYELPKVMTETDQNGPMQMFDTFMQSQRLLITSRHVLDIALQDPIWRTTGHDIPADPGAYFRKHLDVTISPRSEYIQISVSDMDPGLAAAAVNSVINAYQQIYERQERQLEDARMGALGEKSGPLEEKIRSLTQQVNSDSAEFGTSDLSTFYEAAEQRAGKTSAALDDIRNAIALAPDMPAGTEAAPTTEPAMLIEQIAAADPIMHGYVAEEEHWEDELVRLR